MQREKQNTSKIDVPYSSFKEHIKGHSALLGTKKIIKGITNLKSRFAWTFMGKHTPPEGKNGSI